MKWKCNEVQQSSMFQSLSVYHLDSCSTNVPNFTTVEIEHGVQTVHTCWGIANGPDHCPHPQSCGCWPWRDARRKLSMPRSENGLQQNINHHQTSITKISIIKHQFNHQTSIQSSISIIIPSIKNLRIAIQDQVEGYDYGITLSPRPHGPTCEFSLGSSGNSCLATARIPGIVIPNRKVS